VTGIGLASNMKVLLRIFGELFEEESEKSVNVLARRNGVADRTATVRISDIDGLSEKDH